MTDNDNETPVVRPLTDDFYRCPNTGEWVYNWSDERMVLVTSDDARFLRVAQRCTSESEEGS